MKSALLILRPFFIYIWMLSKVCDNVYLVYLVMWFCVGSKLLSGHESDRCHSAHVHEWGRCILGLITATDQSETCHAWWVSLSDSVYRWTDIFVFVVHSVIGDTSLCLPLWILKGFFIPGFPKLQRFQVHHDQILSKLLPKLRKHLVRFLILTSGCLTLTKYKHFLSFFNVFFNSG